MDSQRTAKIVLGSSMLTLLIIAGIVFLSRDSIVDYLVVKVSPPVLAPVAVDAQSQIVSSIARVNPAVVSVIVTKDVPVYQRYYETFGSFGGFSIPRVRENGTQEREVGGGSGFIVSNDGLIVTNRHVVEDTDASYSVLLNNGDLYDVKVLARDIQLDIAILQIDQPLKSTLTFATFGDSQNLELGETVIAIGNALAEFQNSVSVGVVSGLSRTVVARDRAGNSEQLDQVIQTDAAINPGNSGGPLLNSAGEVIGVNVATSRGADNIGFALPAHAVKEIVDSVQEYGEIVRPLLGVRYVMIDERMAQQLGLSVSFGALVVAGQLAGETAVLTESPAAKAGITEGDIILAIDKERLDDMPLATVLRSKQAGQDIQLLVLQDSVEKVISLKLDKAL